MMDTADKMRRNKPHHKNQIAVIDLKKMIISKLDFGKIQRNVYEERIVSISVRRKSENNFH